MSNLPLTKTCEYDECGREFTQGHRTRYRFERMRFCSQDCGRRGAAAGPARGEFCRSGMHVMSGDNVRIDSRGKRVCRGCQADRKAAAASAARPRQEPPAAASDARPSTSAAEPVALAVVGEPRQPWRPPWPVEPGKGDSR